MNESQKEVGPVLRFDINGSAVTVTFSANETPDIKDRVRDILTESYKERIHNTEQKHI